MQVCRFAQHIQLSFSIQHNMATFNNMQYKKEMQDDADGSFRVRESKWLLIVLGIVFSALFIYSFFEYVDDRVTLALRFNAMKIALLPAVVFFYRALNARTVFVINDSGFYYYGKLVTAWENFVSARVVEGRSPGGFQDNFVLHLNYTRPEQAGIYQQKFPLTNTQDKSEEEIIAAIKKYRGAKSDGDAGNLVE
jgi:hypothetical protein